MMVLYRSPERYAVQVNNEDKYQVYNWSSIFLFQIENTNWSGMTWPIIKLIWDLMLIFIVTNFGADWFLFVDVRE